MAQTHGGIMSRISPGTQLPVDDTVLFKGGPFDKQRMRIPFGKPRRIECAVPVGNQIAIYSPTHQGEGVVFNFVNIVDKP